ncbi:MULTISPECIES: hypothetical protein [Symbiopectobacterium]|uniref:hypothetical protein n=1 Tax=Symbiopectobacterium TaxID=801 RepID=UPI00207988CD|nr:MULTISPECIES: hypothetical protein [Symbiopectobacterium]MBT9429487.1 hypothetical protein [Candidatus Symbiopectobacterium endolongispinus]
MLSLTWVVGLLFTSIGFVAQWQTPESNVGVNSLQAKEPIRPFTIMRNIIGYVKHGLKRTTSRLLSAVNEDTKRPQMQSQVPRREQYCRFVPLGVVMFTRR